MSDTKSNILEAAIQLFNKQGVNNVTLRTIADHIDISPGNLAYHYKNKESIIEDAFQQMEAERNQILTGVQEIPSLEIIYDQNAPVLALEKKYLFLNLDALHIIRNHPGFAKLQRKHIEKRIEYTRAVIALSVATGYMKEESKKGEYDRLSESLWIISHYWLTQKELRGIKGDNVQALQDAIWDLILPNMTEKGLYKYKKLFERNKNVESREARIENRED